MLSKRARAPPPPFASPAQRPVRKKRLTWKKKLLVAACPTAGATWADVLAAAAAEPMAADGAPRGGGPAAVVLHENLLLGKGTYARVVRAWDAHGDMPYAAKCIVVPRRLEDWIRAPDNSCLCAVREILCSTLADAEGLDACLGCRAVVCAPPRTSSASGLALATVLPLADGDLQSVYRARLGEDEHALLDMARGMLRGVAQWARVLGGQGGFFDIKSANVLVCAGGELRLGDYGLARSAWGPMEYDVVSLWWRSPECLLGRRPRLDGSKVDAWAVGMEILRQAGGAPQVFHRDVNSAATLNAALVLSVAGPADRAYLERTKLARVDPTAREHLLRRCPEVLERAQAAYPPTLPEAARAVCGMLLAFDPARRAEPADALACGWLAAGPRIALLPPRRAASRPPDEDEHARRYEALLAPAPSPSDAAPADAVMPPTWTAVLAVLRALVPSLPAEETARRVRADVRACYERAARDANRGILGTLCAAILIHVAAFSKLDLPVDVAALIGNCVFNDEVFAMEGDAADAIATVVRLARARILPRVFAAVSAVAAELAPMERSACAAHMARVLDSLLEAPLPVADAWLERGAEAGATAAGLFGARLAARLAREVE